MRSPSQLTITVLLAACLIAVGCKGKKEESAAPGPPPVREVAVVTVEPETILLTTELSGRTVAYRVAEIRPQVNGLIQRRMFKEGSDVKAGDALYRIDPATFEAVLNNAKAALGRSEANLPALRSRAARYKDLLSEKAVSQQDYDDAAAALKQAEADTQFWKASVETAKINLDFTSITAPISGRIGKSNVTEGAIVTAYQPVALATIQQLDPIYVDVAESTADLLRMRQRLEDKEISQDGKGQNKVQLILENGTTYSKEGSFQFRDVTVDPSTGSVTLRVIFPNPDAMLLPGMFVRAVMKEGVNENAILIPQQAVSRDPKSNPVALVVEKDDKVGQRMLTLDRAIKDKWLVSSGLDKGDRVIVEGIQKVRPGTAVKVVPNNENGPVAGVQSENPGQSKSQAN
jgi:membrane fusion protein, multidrug efflux system